MTVRPKTLLLALATFAFAHDASATVPDPRFTTLDDVVVGSPAGAAVGGSPAGYDVVVRDVNNAPRPGVVVTLKFPAGMRLYAGQNAGTTIDCSQNSISRVTDAQGHVNFAARVGGFDDLRDIEVSGDGEVFGSVPGRSTDYDADGKAGLSDFVVFSTDFLNPVGVHKSDFDLNGNTGLGDFTIFSREFLAPGGPQAMCP